MDLHASAWMMCFDVYLFDVTFITTSVILRYWLRNMLHYNNI